MVEEPGRHHCGQGEVKVHLTSDSRGGGMWPQHDGTRRPPHLCGFLPNP